MTFRVLSTSRELSLRGKATNMPADARIDGVLPAGYRRFSRTAVISGRSYADVAHDLMTWQMHERAGIIVHASEREATLGTVVELRLGLGPMSLRAPCRVVDVIGGGEHHRGFTYMTLRGHPESGLEQFVVDRLPHGSIELTITAVSAPASLLARHARWLAHSVQRAITRRYLRALR